MKLFDETRKSYVLITVGLIDIVGFSIIFFVTVFAFAVILQFMYFPYNEVLLWEQNALVVTYALGAFETPGVQEDFVAGFWAVTLALVAATNLLALNSLVAILGDSYGKVQADIDAYDM
jgi:hypothetical protein